MAAELTGWEIDATAVDAILNEDHQTLRAFIDGYGRLAAYDDERKTLAVREPSSRVADAMYESLPLSSFCSKGQGVGRACRRQNGGCERAA